MTVSDLTDQCCETMVTYLGDTTLVNSFLSKEDYLAREMKTHTYISHEP